MNQKRVIQACNKKFKEPTKEIKVHAIRHDIIIVICTALIIEKGIRG